MFQLSGLHCTFWHVGLDSCMVARKNLSKPMGELQTIFLFSFFRPYEKV